MLGSLIGSDHQLYSVSPLETPFRLLISLLQSSPTRNYNHSQLCITLCHIYTAYNHTRSWLQSLITLLHVYTGWLLRYQLLSQTITHSTSSHFPCLSPIETSLVGLFLKTDCLDISVPLINPQSYKRTRQLALCCVIVALAGNMSRDIPLLLGPCDVIAARCVGTVFQYCCVTSSRLRGTLVYRSAT
jgi:hypothetical protein